MKLIKNKFFWAVVIAAFFINGIVNANKEQSPDLLGEYYALNLNDSTEEAEEVVVPVLSKRDSLITYAETLLGKAYRYGMKGPESFDCSGYVYHVLQKFNVTISRSTKYQSKEGELISRDEIQKGDLLFFKSPTPNNPNVGHVGIALENNEGKVKFIHSSTGRGVVIDSLESRHYGKRFMEARRIINN